jgi:virginiamycin B lyase
VGPPTDGLHGLCASQVHPGMVWATMQFTSKVVLLDPKAGGVDEPPVIMQTYTLPAAARGPHVVIEDGPFLWVSAKDGGQVVRIAYKEPQPYTLFTAERRPIFVAVQKSTGLVFATEDQSSSILWIDPAGGKTGQIPIPSDMGSTPVGMIAGPDGNVWFVLLGGSSGGTGRFGRINKDKTIEWYHLAAGAWSKAGLIHLAWENAGPSPGLLLLASSMADGAALNAVVRVTFNPAMSAVDTEAAAVLATANCMTHRVAAAARGWYVTELGGCQIAHVSSNWVGAGLEAIDEADDYFSDFGMGTRSRAVDYR